MAMREPGVACECLSAALGRSALQAAADSAAGAALLVLASAADALVDPRCSQRVAQAWGCVLRTHPSAGHDLPLDDGEWVVREVSAWLTIR